MQTSSSPSSRATPVRAPAPRDYAVVFGSLQNEYGPGVKSATSAPSAPSTPMHPLSRAPSAFSGASEGSSNRLSRTQSALSTIASHFGMTHFATIPPPLPDARASEARSGSRSPSRARASTRKQPSISSAVKRAAASNPPKAKEIVSPFKGLHLSYGLKI